MKPSQRQINLTIFIAVVLQPILDMIAYWLIEIDVFNFVPVLRLVIFAAIVILGYISATKRAVYWIATGVIIGFFILRSIVLWSEGGAYDAVSDAGYYIRFAIPPLLLLAFFSLLRSGGAHMQRVFLTACFVNLLVVGLIVALSHVTNTVNYSYESTGVGSIGWFFSGNGQGMVLIALTAMSLLLGLTSRSVPIIWISSIVGFGLLFLHGSRVAFFAIFAVALVWVVSLLLIRVRGAAFYVPVILCVMIVAAFYSHSPMRVNTNEMQRNIVVATERLNQESTQQERGSAPRAQSTTDGAPKAKLENLESTKEREVPVTAVSDPLEELYLRYVPTIIDRFGYDRVLDAFSHTEDLAVLRDYRVQKNIYAKLSIEERGVLNSLFGQEYASFVHQGRDHEPESDFVTLPYLYGIVGALLYWGSLIGFAVYVCYYSLRLKKEAAIYMFSLTIAGLLIVAGLLGGHAALRTSVSFYIALTLAFAALSLIDRDTYAYNQRGKG